MDSNKTGKEKRAREEWNEEKRLDGLQTFFNQVPALLLSHLLLEPADNKEGKKKDYI